MSLANGSTATMYLVASWHHSCQQRWSPLKWSGLPTAAAVDEMRVGLELDGVLDEDVLIVGHRLQKWLQRTGESKDNLLAGWPACK